MKRRWWLGSIIVVLLGVGFIGYRWIRSRTSEATTAEAQGTQETAVVTRQTLQVVVDAGGSLKPQQEIDLSFETAGRVTDIVVEVGDRLRTGDVLARLDDTDARQSVADAQLQVEQAEVSLALAQLSLNDLVDWEPDETAVELAEANVRAAEADHRLALASYTHRDDKLTSVQVKLDQAQRALDDAEEAYDSAYDPGREWELWDRRLSSRLEAEREMADDQLVRAQEDLGVAQANYDLEIATVDDGAVENAWSKVLNAQKALEDETTPPDDDEIESARLHVRQSEISLEQFKLKLESARESLSDVELVAPMEGTVTELNLAVGQWVGTGQSVASLASLETLVVEIGLDETDIATVSLGQPVVVMLDAFDDVELNGLVSEIAPTADVQSGVVLYHVTVALDPTDVPIRDGMTADVEIVTERADEALVIPLKAVRSFGDRTLVFRKLREGEASPTRRSGKVQERVAALGIPEGYIPEPVQLGLVTDALAEIAGGLEEGDGVLVASSERESTPQRLSPPGGGLGGVMRRP